MSRHRRKAQRRLRARQRWAAWVKAGRPLVRSRDPDIWLSQAILDDARQAIAGVFHDEHDLNPQSKG